MSDSASTGGAGFDLTSLRFRKAAKQLLHPAAREEVGIDGVLELRDNRKRAYGALLLVQIKAFQDVDPTTRSLRYVVKPVDAAYADYASAAPGARQGRTLRRGAAAGAPGFTSVEQLRLDACATR